MNEISTKRTELKQSSSEVGEIRSGQLYLKRRLNPLWATFFIITYTGVIALGTSFLIDAKTDEHKSELKLSEMRMELLEEIRKSKTTTIVRESSGRNEMEKMRAEIIDEVNRINLKYLDIIEHNKTKYSSVISAVSSRNPASVVDGKNVIPYNAVNEEVLLFKHQKQYKREKEKLKEQEKIAINNLDLSKREGIEKMKEIQDNTEIALFQLKKKLFYKRQEFRKDKYIVMND